MNFNKKTVIISGGGSGIGFEVARIFLAYDANVVICGRRETVLEKSIKKLIDIDNGYNSRLACLKTDMSNEHQVEELFEYTKKKFSAVNILINNAGLWRETSLLECSSEEMDLMYNNVLKTTILGTKIGGKMLSEYGSIINIGSFSGILSIKSASMYSTFKASINHFTKSAASELAYKNIRVNCVIPGVIKTPMTEEYINTHYDRLIKPISLKRFGTLKEVAMGILFLASSNASYITGVSLEITGGKYLTQV